MHSAADSNDTPLRVPRGSEDESFGAVDRAVRLASLCADPASLFATFRSVEAAAVPEPYRRLLDHHSHMTVTMERFHGSPVSLQVVQVAGGAAADSKQSNGSLAAWYAREILLVGPDANPLQHGIVRIDLQHVDDVTAAAIREAQIPLGRILINAGLLREVHRVSLLEVTLGPHLVSLFSPQETVASGNIHTFGRVAEISLNGTSAVELLEIVVPFRSVWPAHASEPVA